eukprot:15153166-Alexandrium_andersonii.AAC.1
MPLGAGERKAAEDLRACGLSVHESDLSASPSSTRRALRTCGLSSQATSSRASRQRVKAGP